MTTTLILTLLLSFIVVNLALTVVLRYYNGNDGWLELLLTKARGSSIIESDK